MLLWHECVTDSKCFLKKKQLETLSRSFPFPHPVWNGHWFWITHLDVSQTCPSSGTVRSWVTAGAFCLVPHLGASPLQVSRVMAPQRAFENTNRTISVSHVNSFSDFVAFQTWFLHLLEVPAFSITSPTACTFPHTSGIPAMVSSWQVPNSAILSRLLLLWVALPRMLFPCLPFLSLICTPTCISGVSLISLIRLDALSLCPHRTLHMLPHTPSPSK